MPDEAYDGTVARDGAGPGGGAPRGDRPAGDLVGELPVETEVDDGPVAAPGSAAGWLLLAVVALPALAYALVAARDLTGRGQLFQGPPDNAYDRVAVLVIGVRPTPGLIACLVGLAVVGLVPALLPGGWSTRQRQASCGLAGLVALEGAAQVVLLGYLWLADPPADGSGFSVDGSQLDQLSGPLAEGLVVVAVAVLVGVLLGRAPVTPRPHHATAEPDGDAALDLPAGPAPGEDLPEDPREPARGADGSEDGRGLPAAAPEGDADPYARYRRPGT